MLRDWSALICLGSSVEVEMTGVEGVGFFGVGVDFGAGELEGLGAVGALVGEIVVVVGGWSMEERVVEERRRRWRRKMRGLRMKTGGEFEDAIFLGLEEWFEKIECKWW